MLCVLGLGLVLGPYSEGDVDFAPKVAKYPKSSPKPRERASLLFRSVSDAACWL